MNTELAPYHAHIYYELDDRAQDVWEPLLAIADVAGDDWPQAARRAAIELSDRRSSSEDTTAGAIKLTVEESDVPLYAAVMIAF